MLKSGIVWKMAWHHLRRQKLHTVLSVVGASIGVTLLIAAVVFYESFEYSEQRWIQAHYGPVEWELVPADGSPSFTEEQVRQIVDYPGNRAAGISYLPAVSYSATAVRPGAPGQAGEAAERLTVLGLDFAAAADFASTFASAHDEWRMAEPGDGEAVLTEPAASLLGLAAGDALGIRDVQGNIVYFRVAEIAEERGIAGYRDGVLTSGTVLLNEREARRLAGIPDGAYSLVFATKPANPDYVVGDPPDYPFRFSHVTVASQKASALATLERWKWTYAAVLALTSGFAAVSGLLLVRQMLLLQLDYRRETAAVLRAIGLGRRQVRQIFFAEAGLFVAIGTLAGTVAGSAAGYGIVWLFRNVFAKTLMKYSALSVPLVPHVSVRTVALAGACLLAVLLLAAWLAGGRAGKVPIVETMRAGLGGSVDGRPGKTVHGALLLAGCAVTAAHLYDLFSGSAVRRLSEAGTGLTFGHGSVFLLWVLASVAVPYLLLSAAQRLEPRLRGLVRRLGIAPVSSMMALRFPSQNMHRSFAIALMFSLVFMMLMSTVTFAVPMMRHQEANVSSKTFLGYPAVVPYGNGQERGRIETLIRDDDRVRNAIRHLAEVKPYRLDMEAPGALAGRTAFSIVGVDEAYLKAARPALHSRASEFATDEDAWDAVLHGDDYVILHEKFAYAASDGPGHTVRDGMPLRRLEPGETIEVYIYPNLSSRPFSFESEGFRALTEEELREAERKMYEEIEERKRKENTPVGVRRMKIAGFAGMEERFEYYNAWFVPPSFAEAFRGYGYRWPDDTAEGFWLLDVDVGDLETVHRMQERFLLAGFDSLKVPALEQMARSAMDRHTYLIFIAFMMLSVWIGMAGLAVVQHRAVRERARQLAMMRFIGIGRRQISQMFLLEGVWIGWTGIWNGALFGSLGGYLLFRVMEVNWPPGVPPLAFRYPVAQAAAILAVAMLSAWLLNLWPARKGNRLPPAEAIRVAD